METHLLTTRPMLPRKLGLVKRRLKRHRISAWTVAQAAGVSEAMVWMVLAGRRTSARVLAVADALLAERKKGSS